MWKFYILRFNRLVSKNFLWSISKKTLLKKKKKQSREEKRIKRCTTWLVSKLHVMLLAEETHKIEALWWQSSLQTFTTISFSNLLSGSSKFTFFQYMYVLSMALGHVFPSFVQFHHQTLSPSFKPSTVRKTILARSSNGQEPSSSGSLAVKEKKAFPGIL